MTLDLTWGELSIVACSLASAQRRARNALAHADDLDEDERKVSEGIIEARQTALDKIDAELDRRQAAGEIG